MIVQDRVFIYYLLQYSVLFAAYGLCQTARYQISLNLVLMSFAYLFILNCSLSGVSSAVILIWVFTIKICTHY